MGAWDSLSIREKAEMMKAAIRNGITTLPEIKQAYNEFAEGGNIYGNGGQKKSGGSFYQTHRARWFNFLCKKGVNPVKAERLASYFSAQDALESGHGTSSAARQKNNYGGMQRLDKKTNKMVNVSYGSIDDYMNAKWKMMNNRFGRALNAKSIQEYANILNDPKYHGKGYMYGLYEGYRDGQPLDVARQTKYMNNYTKIMMDIAGEKGFKGAAVPEGIESDDLSIVQPENPYTQFIPFEPFNPQVFNSPQAFVAPTREQFEVEQPIVEAAKDYTYSPEQLEREERRQGLNNLSFILGMMNGGNGSSFADTIGMLTGNIAAEGGKIHIKPENRGKFTALKKRTGHSATWFKEHGTPAQKKMATFALNARHWKHGLGGNLYLFGGDDDNNPRPVTTGGAGYVPPVSSPNFINKTILNASRDIMGFRIAASNKEWDNERNLPSEEQYGGIAQRTFLAGRKLQEEEFKKHGFIKDTSGNYGLVKKAVGNNKYPIWQRTPDEVSRENIIPIGNTYNKSYTGIPYSKDLISPGSYPTAYYVDPSTVGFDFETGAPKQPRFYAKSWDLNDYGGKGGSTAGILGKVLDFIGNPVVQTTGYIDITKTRPESVDNMLEDYLYSKGLERHRVDENNLYSAHFFGLPEVTITGKKRRGKKHGYGGNLYDGFTEDNQQMNIPYAGELPNVTVMPRRITNKAWDKVQERWVGDMPTYYAVNPETGKEEMLREIGNGKYSTYDDKHVFDVLGAEEAKKEREQWIKNGGNASDFDKIMLGTLGLGLAPIALPEIAAGVSSLPIWDAMGTGAETLLAKQGVQNALPWIKSGIASYFAADGLNRFIGPEGAAKTDRMFSTMVDNPNWYNMVNFGKSALGDVLDVSMAGPVVNAATGLKFSTEAAADLLSAAKNTASKATLSAEEALKKGYNKSRIFAKDLFARHSPTFEKYRDTQNRLYEYMRDYGKAELDAASEKRIKARALYNKYRRNYNSTARVIETKQDAFVRNGKINWDKLSLEDREKFFRKHGTQDPEVFAKTYNPNTGEFEYETDRTFFEGFKPSDAVTTGDIQIKDLQTGKLQSFNIKAPDVGGVERVKYAFNPNNPYGAVREVSAERKSAAQALAPTMPEGYADAIQKNMDYVNSTILPGSRPFGSTTNIAKGNLVHGSHDIDVIMTEAQMKKHPEAKNFYEKIGGATYGYNHPQAGEIDINIIREKRGKAYGQRAHELYAQLFPEEYQKLMMSYAEKGKEINTEIPLNISAQKLLDAYDPVTKGIADAFGSGKDKHMKRALYYLHYGDVNDVRNGFDMYANYLLGGKYKPSSIALSEFDNPQANAQLIDELGLSAINKEQFINDPERMKLLFDYAVFDKSFVGRGVSNENDDIIKSLTYWYPDTNGGTFNGVGLNTVIGGNSGHGDIYATLVPNRLNISTGPTPRDVLNSLVKDKPLSSEEINDVIQIANAHNVPMNDPQTFADILRQTEGKNGENYKEFINDLAKRFDRPFIEGGQYGNAPYASLLEDQSKSAIQQIIPYGMDRPTPSSARDMVARTHIVDEQQGNNFKEAMEVVNKESRNRDVFKSIAKKGAGWEESGLAKIANKHYKKASDEASKIYAKVQADLSNPDIIHLTALNKIQENYHKYARLLDRIRTGIKVTGAGAGVGGLAIGVNKLLTSETTSDLRTERRKKYSQLKRSMKEGEQE